MKKSIFHVSLMIGLTTLFTACSHHKPSPHSPEKDPIKEQRMPIDQSTYTSEWSGLACGYGYCYTNKEKPNQVSVYKSNTANNTNLKDHLTKISLLSGKNTHNNDQKEFVLNLIQEKDIGLAYYGYRVYAYKNDTKSDIQMVYGINKDYVNNAQLKDFSAQYKGKNSFIYSNFSEGDKTHNAQYADITLNYNNGQITGEVTKDQHEKLFTISGKSDRKILITPTVSGSSIGSDVGIFDIQLINSAKNSYDKKYMIGSGIAETWSGVFFAEKQNETQTTKP